MNTTDILIIGTIIVYLILMVVIGLIVSKKTTTSEISISADVNLVLL